jgi:hypothetical protein
MSTDTKATRQRRPQSEVDKEKVSVYFKTLTLSGKLDLVKELKASISEEQESLTRSLELIKSSNI